MLLYVLLVLVVVKSLQVEMHNKLAQATKKVKMLYGLKRTKMEA